MSNLHFEIVQRKSYRAVGMKWSGPWNEINELKQVIATMRIRVKELTYCVEPHIQLGLSYHYRPDGFTHYSMFEVTEHQAVPDDMIEMHIPELTYFVTKYKHGENVGDIYRQILQWITKSNYKPYSEENVTYYDELPIKHEKYPDTKQSPDAPSEIWIPIIEICNI